MQSKDLGKFSTNFKDKQVKRGYKWQNQEKEPLARLMEIAGSWLFPLLNKCFADDRNTRFDAPTPYFGNQTISIEKSGTRPVQEIP